MDDHQGKKPGRSLRKIACLGPAREDQIKYGEEGITRWQERYRYPEPNVFFQVKVPKKENLV